MDKRDYLIEIRDSSGMSRKEFCEYFEIPYRTLQDWELGNREMPDYLLRLMAYKLKTEQIISKKEYEKGTKVFEQRVIKVPGSISSKKKK